STPRPSTPSAAGAGARRAPSPRGACASRATRTSGAGYSSRWRSRSEADAVTDAETADPTPDPEPIRPPRLRDEPMPSWVPRAIALFFVGFVAVLVLGWLLQKLQSLLVILLVSLFISFA